MKGFLVPLLLSACSGAGGYFLSLSWVGGFIKPTAAQGAPEVVVLKSGEVLVLRDGDYYKVDYPSPDEKLVREALKIKAIPHRFTPDAPEGILRVKIDGRWEEARVGVGPAPKPLEELLAYLVKARGADVVEGPVIPEGLVLKVQPYDVPEAQKWEFPKPLKEDTLWGEDAKALREFLKGKAYYLAPEAGLFEFEGKTYKVWVLPLFER